MNYTYSIVEQPRYHNPPVLSREPCFIMEQEGGGPKAPTDQIKQIATKFPLQCSIGRRPVYLRKPLPLDML